MTKLTWLITGCSSGFGEEFARSLIARGDNVIATARDNAQERLAVLKDAGAAIVDLDVTSYQTEIDAKIEGALKIYGGIDVLLNCAGYIESGTVEEMCSERLDCQFATNLFGVINVTRAILPHFRQARSGTIVFLGSSAGIEGEPGVSAYCATKFALEG